MSGGQLRCTFNMNNITLGSTLGNGKFGVALKAKETLVSDTDTQTLVSGNVSASSKEYVVKNIRTVKYVNLYLFEPDPQYVSMTPMTMNKYRYANEDTIRLFKQYDKTKPTDATLRDTLMEKIANAITRYFANSAMKEASILSHLSNAPNPDRRNDKLSAHHTILKYVGCDRAENRPGFSIITEFNPGYIELHSFIYNKITHPAFSSISSIIKQTIEDQNTIGALMTRMMRRFRNAIMNIGNRLTRKNPKSVAPITQSNAGASAKTASAKTASAKTATAKPASAKTATAKPASAKTATANPASAKPATAKPATANPASANPASAKTASAKTATAKPATAKPATAKPATKSRTIHSEKTIKAEIERDAQRIYHCITQLYEGLVEIHKRGVVHRDIKMTNILINPTTGDIKYIDFGLSAFFADNKRLFNGIPSGTLTYKPPVMQIVADKYPWIVNPLYYSIYQDYWAVSIVVYHLVYVRPEILKNNKPNIYETKLNVFREIPHNPTSEITSNDLFTKNRNLEKDVKIIETEIQKIDTAYFSQIPYYVPIQRIFSNSITFVEKDYDNFMPIRTERITKIIETQSDKMTTA
jgi:Protein kinase domain